MMIQMMGMEGADTKDGANKQLTVKVDWDSVM